MPINDDLFLQHKELYELATRQGRISVWEVDYRTNHLEFSPVLAKLLGLTVDLIPTTVEGWSRHFYPEDWQRLERESERMLRHEIAELNLECRMLRADGQFLWILVRSKASFDEQGRPLKAIGTAVDITERKKAEEERDLFFTLSLDLLCIADLSGFRRVNPTFCRTLGYTEEELTSKPFLDFVHPDDLQATQDQVAKLATGKNVIEFENRYRCKDGTYRWLSWQCPAPMPGSNLLYAIARDVTKAKEAHAELERAKKEAEQANRAKSEFLSRMSHELRTPLNAILGFGQLLQREPLTPRQHQQIELIVKGGRHLLDLINEVLDITRIEVGRLDLSPEPVNLADVIQEVVNLTQPMADQRSIHISIDEASMAKRSVLADKQRLKQVLLNLVANAIKYNVERGRVILRCEPAPEQRLQIQVQDTGPGISPAKQSRLFTPFDRLGAEMTPIEGSGLGLVLSRRLVEVMGGTLTCVSQAEQGTTFTIELAQARDPQVLADGHPLPAALDNTGPARTVLYIEDNDANVKLIEAVVAHQPGIRLLTALQGNEGLDLARQHHPDLILLDVHLPDVKGCALMRSIHADPTLCDIPVVVISADATKRQIDNLLEAGAREYMTKPIDVDQLLRMLDRYLA